MSLTLPIDPIERAQKQSSRKYEGGTAFPDFNPIKMTQQATKEAEDAQKLIDADVFLTSRLKMQHSKNYQGGSAFPEFNPINTKQLTTISSKLPASHQRISDTLAHKKHVI